ncbi:uncharacterized protein [Diabrotica undecimpunctata]|uniref:uncharacterized protein n=1 Tax=Diabrotica undecimpunctata TaxID=50387 RepID=UPI003B63E76C
MERKNRESNLEARAFLVSDAQLRPRLTRAKSGLGLPLRKRKGPKKLLLRVATLNVGNMSGKGRELTDFMQRKIGVLCLQETRWKGKKSRDLGDGCTLIYSSSNSHGRNGVGIILNNE